jgi:transposase
MSNLFWLSDEQFAATESVIPTKRRGVKPRRNRQVISAIFYVLKVGCRWQDCPAEYGPYTTIYNRFNRWSKAGIWARIVGKLLVHDAADVQCVDSATAKAHRCAAGGKGGPRRRPSARAEADARRKSTRSLTEMVGSSLSN